MAQTLCPICGVNYFTPYGDEYVDGESAPFPALSRKDNETYVCTQCGMREAMEDWRFFGERLVYEALTEEVDGHAKIAIVIENEGGYHKTDLKWGDYATASEACRRVNTLAGYGLSEAAFIVLGSMRLSGMGEK